MPISNHCTVGARCNQYNCLRVRPPSAVEMTGYTQWHVTSFLRALPIAVPDLRELDIVKWCNTIPNTSHFSLCDKSTSLHPDEPRSNTFSIVFTLVYLYSEWISFFRYFFLFFLTLELMYEIQIFDELLWYLYSINLIYIDSIIYVNKFVYLFYFYILYILDRKLSLLYCECLPILYDAEMIGMHDILRKYIKYLR